LQPDVEAFERLVLSQKPAEKPWQPTAAVPYDFESRKIAEGKHPELIREVFQPARVTDVGCGHGHLMRLLQSLGVDVIGLDLQNFGAYPFEPCDISRPINWEYGGHQRRELVICREVLEHLTVQQIAAAVRNLCALSSRFVYVTTRFTQARHFLDFATSDDLDPTHISIMPQAWLRHLFTLEGFTRRADLEQRLDWQHKGRVLVYERAA
jgi:SAM-dependent methyltransferase